MQLALDILVVTILLALSIQSVVKMFKTRRVRSADLICLVIFFFYAMPLVYDRLFTFDIPYWFAPSRNDSRTCILYDIVVLVSVLLIKAGAHISKKKEESYYQEEFTDVPLMPGGFISVLTSLAWIGLLAPLPAVLLLSPSPGVYLGYYERISAEIRATAGYTYFASMHAIISLTCTVALLSFFLIYWVRVRMTRTSYDIVQWIAIFFVLIAIYIHAKRSSILFFFAIIGIVNFLEHRLKFKTVLAFAVFLLVAGYAYIGLAKGYERTVPEYIRSDLCRDYTLRHVIYRSELTKSSLVPYRGATYLFVLTAYYPRAWWPDKPWTAPYYLTNDVFHWTGFDYIGWGFGLGFMEELIMNFGFLGLAGCFLIGRFSRWLDRFIYQRSSYYAVLWLPMVFACVFAASVVLNMVILLVIPVFLFRKIFTSEYAWTPVYTYEDMAETGEYTHLSEM